jgi:uncharacterized membrane protein YkvA (DUF1232 family)
MKTYYDYLNEELHNYDGEFDRFILYIPDLFKLLCDMMDQKIDAQDRQNINSALAYFVLPNDFLPEDVHGPMGYADDAFVCAMVVKKLLEKYGDKMIEDLWENEEDLRSVIDTCLEKGKKILDEMKLTDQLLEYVGLV